jgi:hypothetical protein
MVQEDDEAAQARYIRTEATTMVFRQSKFVCGHCGDKRPKTLASLKQHWYDKKCDEWVAARADEDLRLLQGVTTSRALLETCVRNVRL